MFISMVLKGDEVSLRYGYDYDSSAEKYFILKLMGTVLSKGDEWISGNAAVDEILTAPPYVSDEIIKEEIQNTARMFASDMLLLKFVQGLPIVGAIGGAFNPVYYSKIMNYVRLKYHKRYLTDKLQEAR